MTEEKRVYTVATAHLDTVWRWDLPETIRQYLPDTISDNFYLFQTVPGYTFNFEGAYRYHLIEEYYPDLFEQIQDYVRCGQWHISGSAYENGDVNLPSPEALFRNILLGNLYFEEKFGKRSKDLFLPDCFGFGSALPTVIRASNLLGFTTQKLSWGSAYGRPFDLGLWQGIDGTRCYACLDGRSYRSRFRNVRTDPSVQEKLTTAQAYGAIPWTLHLHGNGDKGGAPDVTSALAVSRAENTNAANQVKVFSAASDQIFRDLDALDDTEKARLPVSSKELLLTSHGAGSYTSRAMSKRLNRQNETMADRAERSAVTAYTMAGYPYPGQTLNTAWKRVIVHQFHDDITGTSNMEVYNRSWRDYFQSLFQFQQEMTGAVNAIAGELDTSFVQGTAVVVNNPVAADRTDAVHARVRMGENSPYVQVFDHHGNEVPSQVVQKRGKQFDLVFLAHVPSLGYTVYDVRPSGVKCSLPSSLKVTEHSLENEKYKLLFNKNGDIASLFDKELNKQLLRKPVKLALLKDTGALNYPAWELRYQDVMAEPYAYANTPTFRVVMRGAAKVAVEVTRTAGGSVFTQIVSLAEGGRFVTVENRVGWQSRRTLLKVQFPLTVSCPEASYDLGLGVIRRPSNTKELYEVPAQKWADLSETKQDYGVSIFSDCKYGWDKPDDNTLRLTAIHTPAGAFTKETRQDLQDLGENRFGFALFSHSGSYTMGTQLQSEFYANPLIAFQTTAREKGPLGASYSFGSIHDKGVLVRAMKKAEQGDAIIVRVNEALGVRHRGVSLSLAGGIVSAQEVYASEEPLGEAQVQNGVLLFDIEPYEVKTFALHLQPAKPPQVMPSHPMDLPWNVDVITDNRNRQTAIMAASGTSLPLELFPATLNCGGIPFRLNRDGRPYNALVPREQHILLPKGCNKLYLLAASVQGDRQVTFKVDQKPRTFTIHDFTEPVGQWEMQGLSQNGKVKQDAVPALEFSHTHSPIDDNYGEPATFFLYEIDMKNGKELVLPHENRIVILAATAVAAPYTTQLATQFVDCAPEAETPQPPELADKVRDKLDLITIQAGKVQDQMIAGKGKGFLRNNPVTNVIRSFTKSEW